MSAALTVLDGEGASLPHLIDKASQALLNARSAAEVLEARDMASMAYDIAKKAGRMAQAKGAHDTLIAAAHRAQADALLIESQAKRRLADEYDAAQERGELATQGGDRHQFKVENANVVTAADVGISRYDVMEARRIRDAEDRAPGIVQRVLDDALERGVPPTRADVKRAVGPTQYLNERAAEEEKTLNDKRDFRNLRKLWNASSREVKEQFRQYIEGGK